MAAHASCIMGEGGNDSSLPIEPAADRALHLHYAEPAGSWTEALPIGNGRLGAMVHGRTTTELLQLNEDSVWYGGPQERTPRDALRNLPRLRALIRAERHREAEALAREAFFATPASMRHYEPLGTCTFEFGHAATDVEAYERRLDLATAEATTEYRCRGVSYRRHAVASFPDAVLAVRFEASEPTRFVVRLDRVSETDGETNAYLDSIHAEGERILLEATPGGRHSNRLALVLGVLCEGGGTVEAVGNCLVVNASRATIALGAQTTFREADPVTAARRDVDEALRRPWHELLWRHRADYAALFDRMSIRMFPDASHLPTDERIKNNRDPGLAALYANYGRYLLISSSRASPKALPANLQGIWNPSFAPAWGSKYTININLQMNYWPAAPCDLIECAEPVVDLLERMAARGRKTAAVMYGCRGWCAHHNTDIWADTSPQDHWLPSTMWPLGGVWVCIDVVKTLEYRYDRALHNRAAAVLEGCVEFLLDFLIPSSCGRYLITSPSVSPENIFISDNGEPGVLCEGSAIDMTIVRIAFEQFLWSSAALDDKENPLRPRVRDALSRIPPLLINKDGLIQEWGLRDYKEHEPGHRHVSHLFGLHPYDNISPVTSPEWAAAAKKVLERRAAHGGGHTGWSRAWLLNLHARLLDAEACERHMDLLLRDSTQPNMLDTHPPFQIDGNFGGCAGVLECLVQSRLTRNDPENREVEVRLLPALPRTWSSGKISGIRVKGGWFVTLEWRYGHIIEPVVMESEGNGAQVEVFFPGDVGSSVRICKQGKHLILRKTEASTRLDG